MALYYNLYAKGMSVYMFLDSMSLGMFLEGITVSMSVHQYVSGKYECVYRSRCDASSTVLHDPNLKKVVVCEYMPMLSRLQGTVHQG